jgi:hypothetical protein
MRALAEALGGPEESVPAPPDLLARHPPARRLLLVVDQLEELFTQNNHAEQARFLRALKALAAEESCAVVVGLRADFYADLMNSDLWPVDPSQRLEVGPLRGETLREAIKRPAAEVGVYLEAGLLERLLADAADEPGVLPLVQETMVLLWEEMERRLLPYAAYERLGQGSRNGLAVAMATKADATLAELTEAQQRVARRVLLRLVQFGEGRADTRRQQPLEELRSAGDEPAEFDRVLEHLTRNRLLTVSGEGDARARVVDIAHEMLIVGWPRCQGWVQSRREAELVRRRLEVRAKEWQARVRQGHAGGLLDEAELPEAERWLRGPDAEDLGYDEALPELVGASRAALEEAERKREAGRRRELEQARALAEAERRRVRNLRMSLLFVATLLLVVAGTAAFAWHQSGMLEKAREKQRRQHAESNARLAGEAIRRGGWEVVLEASDRALKDASLVPDEVGLRLARVRAFTALNRLAEAEQELEGLAARADLGPHEGLVLLLQGDLLLEGVGTGSSDKALALVRAARAKGLTGADRDYADALLAERTHEAVRLLRQALAQDPMHHRANAMLATTLFWSGRLRECHDRIAFAEEAFPEDAVFKVLHALLSARQGDRADATARLRKARQQNLLSEPQLAAVGPLVEAMAHLHHLDGASATLAARDAGLGTILSKAVVPRITSFLDAQKLEASLRDKQGTARNLALARTPPVVKGAYARVVSLMFRSTLPKLLRGSPDRLIKEIDDSIRVYPDGMLYLMKGLLQEEKGPSLEAEESYRQASKTPSLYGSYARVQALCFMAFAQADRARKEPRLKGDAVRTVQELVREVVGLEGLHPDQAVTVATIALVVGEPDLARWVLREGERQGPSTLALLRCRLLAERVAQNWLGAIDAARKLLAVKANDPDAVKAHDDALDRLRKQVHDAQPLKPARP